MALMNSFQFHYFINPMGMLSPTLQTELYFSEEILEFPKIFRGNALYVFYVRTESEIFYIGENGKIKSLNVINARDDLFGKLGVYYKSLKDVSDLFSSSVVQKRTKQEYLLHRDFETAALQFFFHKQSSSMLHFEETTLHRISQNIPLQHQSAEFYLPRELVGVILYEKHRSLNREKSWNELNILRRVCKTFYFMGKLYRKSPTRRNNWICYLSEMQTQKTIVVCPFSNFHKLNIVCEALKTNESRASRTEEKRILPSISHLLNIVFFQTSDVYHAITINLANIAFVDKISINATLVLKKHDTIIFPKKQRMLTFEPNFNIYITPVHIDLIGLNTKKLRVSFQILLQIPFSKFNQFNNLENLCVSSVNDLDFHLHFQHNNYPDEKLSSFYASIKCLQIHFTSDTQNLSFERKSLQIGKENRPNLLDFFTNCSNLKKLKITRTFPDLLHNFPISKFLLLEELDIVLKKKQINEAVLLFKSLNLKKFKCELDQQDSCIGVFYAPFWNESDYYDTKFGRPKKIGKYNKFIQQQRKDPNICMINYYKWNQNTWVTRFNKRVDMTKTKFIQLFLIIPNYLFLTKI